MSSISKIEDMIAGWLKPLPHLPTAGQKWISQNIWWIVLIGVILSGIRVLALIGILFATSAVWGAITYYVNESYSGWWILSSIISILFMAAIVIVSAISINPLKGLKKKGWNLLFFTLLLSAASIVVSVIISFNVFSFMPSLIFGAIGLAVGAYFLYEIRSHFIVTKK
ncbi:MAG TPA: hypothetical protein VFD55_01135 [Candidatus Angelobacter sp.]|nr:hypothetical protein [Candidatus Angelobacter sp.]